MIVLFITKWYHALMGFKEQSVYSLKLKEESNLEHSSILTIDIGHVAKGESFCAEPILLRVISHETSEPERTSARSLCHSKKFFTPSLHSIAKWILPMMFRAVLSTFTADLQSVTDYINEGKILFVKNACFIDYGVIDHIIKTSNKN